MNDTGVIDLFLDTFTRYIDSGFGLLGSEIGFLSSTLIAIDVTIAGLFWAWGADEDVLQRLIKKTLYIGAFAFIIGNFSNLANIVFQSFAGLGLKAAGGGMALADFLKPGNIAATGLQAAKPLLDAAGQYASMWAFFSNAVLIAVLLLGWIIVVLAFFILAIQVFITLIEFKLVTLAGFVLLPFAFWNRTAFMAERVLGHIVSTGIKVLVLAVITGIGTTLFSQFTSINLGVVPDKDHVMAIALAALSLLGLAIFGPGIANGIVSGGPVLGAGAAAGTALAAGGMVMGGAAGARLAAGAAAGAIGGVATGGARVAGAASGAYSLGSAGKSGAASVTGGVGGVGKAAAGAALSPLRSAAASVKQSYESGRSATSATSSAAGADAAPDPSATSGPPAWAKAMKHRQVMSHGASVATHTLRGGDGGGGGVSVDVSEKD
ncbi:P-type conjugative transfer protein TrbL [Nitrobacter sp.]|uniref:P-type conjugative transfer protein TrbL n=1 Tax=Nitrobacter sp. TaxID=29420 RepID=UPI0029CABF74|nr:P-type conjugative transfer protein TrbL [Nitrobacter sp.]